MAALILFLDEDDNPITTLNLGAVDFPDTSENTLIKAVNVGDVLASEITISLQPVGDNDGDDYAKLSADSGGSPTGFSSSSVLIGDVDVLEEVPLWTRTEIPTGITADDNPRRYTIRASGYTL